MLMGHRRPPGAPRGPGALQGGPYRHSDNGVRLYNASATYVAVT